LWFRVIGFSPPFWRAAGLYGRLVDSGKSSIQEGEAACGGVSPGLPLPAPN
jgi:hypothetical protein